MALLGFQLEALALCRSAYRRFAPRCLSEHGGVCSRLRAQSEVATPTRQKVFQLTPVAM